MNVHWACESIHFVMSTYGVEWSEISIFNLFGKCWCIWHFFFFFVLVFSKKGRCHVTCCERVSYWNINKGVCCWPHTSVVNTPLTNQHVFYSCHYKMYALSECFLKCVWMSRLEGMCWMRLRIVLSVKKYGKIFFCIIEVFIGKCGSRFIGNSGIANPPNVSRYEWRADECMNVTSMYEMHLMNEMIVIWKMH